MYVEAYIKGANGDAWNTKPERFEVAESIPAAIDKMTWDYHNEGIDWETRCERVCLDLSNGRTSPDREILNRYFFVEIEVTPKNGDDPSCEYFAIKNYYEDIQDIFDNMSDFKSSEEYMEAVYNFTAAAAFYALPHIVDWLIENQADIDDYEFSKKDYEDIDWQFMFYWED